MNARRVRPWDTAEGRDFFSVLTARHLLGQASGSGIFPPGANFTYSSGDAVQTLERLLAKVAKTKHTAAWATTHFARPLGIPGLFAEDGHAFSAGGGQQTSCRDAACPLEKEASLAAEFLHLRSYLILKHHVQAR